MRASEVMTARPACCSPEDTVSRAAQLMEQNDCGCIPVVDGGCICGVITDRDIAVRGVAHGQGPDAPVRALMTRSLHCCSPDADLIEVESMMAEHQLRRVVVVDDEACCVGIIAQADLARAADRGADVSDEEVALIVERISEPSHSRLHH